MLTLSVDLRGAGPWEWRGEAEGWGREADRVRPLDHPALEARAVTDGTRTLLVVREKAAGRPSLLRSLSPARVDEAVYGRALEECRQWPLQGVWIESGPHGLCLSTGLGGVCPLYLAYDGGHLTGSWQLMDLHHRLGADRLDEREVMRLLTGLPRYGHDTLFSTVKRLSERSTAYADARGLRLVYPAAAEHAQPSELAGHVGEAELVGAFEALTDHVFAKRPLAPGRTAAQLSGGMDSTNLAISLALAHPGAITPCAMLIGGDAGAQQEARRRSVIEQTGFAADVTVRAADHPVLSPGCGAPGLRRSVRWTSRTWRPPTPSPKPCAPATSIRWRPDSAATRSPEPAAPPVGPHGRRWRRPGAGSGYATCWARWTQGSPRRPWRRRPR
ncbi:hypothetical protein [Streptomyces bacillaris]|uniref:hypothetical protein n=1 Tax=Streptomyces bacillaris TaxID=68179 RepID=UPI0036384F87